MRSGLWILIVVIIAGLVVGTLLKQRLEKMEMSGEFSKLQEITQIEDPQVKISRLKQFIAEEPPGRERQYAYRALASEMIQTVKDTSGFENFAQTALDKEDDPSSLAMIYYWLYKIRSDSSSVRKLAGSLLEGKEAASWIYNYISWDLAEKSQDLDIALDLCDRAIELATERMDSASYIDTKGWIFFRQGNYDEAVKYLETAVSLLEEPEEEILRHLAYASLAAGDGDKAFKTFKSILILGEYDYARSALDSLMTARGYTPQQRKQFDEAIWKERMASARFADAFTLPMLSGGNYEFKPPLDEVTVINFTAPG